MDVDHSPVSSSGATFTSSEPVRAWTNGSISLSTQECQSIQPPPPPKRTLRDIVSDSEEDVVPNKRIGHVDQPRIVPYSDSDDEDEDDGEVGSVLSPSPANIALAIVAIKGSINKGKAPADRPILGELDSQNVVSKSGSWCRWGPETVQYQHGPSNGVGQDDDDDDDDGLDEWLSPGYDFKARTPITKTSTRPPAGSSSYSSALGQSSASARYDSESGSTSRVGLGILGSGSSSGGITNIKTRAELAKQVGLPERPRLYQIAPDMARARGRRKQQSTNQPGWKGLASSWIPKMYVC